MFFVLFLSKSFNTQLDNIAKIFSNKKIIYDNHYDDTILKTKGFIGLTKTIKQPSAWDKAFYFLYNNPSLVDLFDYFFFIEDDVFSKNNEMLYNFCVSLQKYDHDLISKNIESKQQSLNWHWWKIDKNYKEFTNHIKCFNPFCRLSKRLIKNILEYRQTHNRFMFHEILFSSLVADLNMRYLDIANIEEKKYIGNFIWRPIIDISLIKDEKIYHPVKPIYSS